MTDHIEDRLLKLAEKATPGPWVRGWWGGQAEKMCDCSQKGALLGKRKQNDYPGAGPFHIHATDFFPDSHRISGTAPEYVEVAGNYDYEEGGIVEENDAAYLVSCPPEVVAAMCRVVEAAREDLLGCHVCYCDEAWRERGLHAPECKFDEVDDLRADLAALDAMEEKAE